MKVKDNENQTNATVSIHDNIIFVREGKKNDGEKFVAYFTYTSLRHPIFPHRLILLIIFLVA